MKSTNNPSWWKPELDSAWERTKEAFKRDWDQTKHDIGGAEPDTNQQVGNTVKQALGKESIPPRYEPTYEEIEPAYRFGFGARSQYRDEYPEWDEELVTRLQKDWKNLNPNQAYDWEKYRAAIRHGWEYEDEDELHTKYKKQPSRPLDFSKRQAKRFFPLTEKEETGYERPRI